jgi:hypothetical protein
VWKNSYSANTNLKIWAAKLTARHPNLVALEMSSFKCGHDAPIYTVVESIIEQSGTPYFAFKDVDENKPTGSIRIRVETIHYFLKRYIETLKEQKAPADVELQLKEYEARIRQQLLLEQEYAALAARQQEESARWRTLPVLPLGQGGTCDTQPQA